MTRMLHFLWLPTKLHAEPCRMPSSCLRRNGRCLASAEGCIVEDLLCGAPSCSEACFFFSNDLLCLRLQFRIIFSMTLLGWLFDSSQFRGSIDVLPSHIPFPICLWTIDPHSRAAKKNANHGKEVLPQYPKHPLGWSWSCYQWELTCQDPTGNHT